MKRFAALCLLFATAATAQMKLVQVTGPASEKDLPAVLALGAVAVGESTTVTLRVRNIAQSTLVVRTVVLAGSGFTMSGQPTLPHQLAPGLNMDVEVRFSPRDYGTYSASFSVNGVSVMLTGSSTAAAVLMTGGAQIPSSSVVDLGLAERGARIIKTFRLANTTPEPVTVQTANVTGNHFQLAQDLPLPLELAPGNAYEFNVVFAPSASGVFQGAIAINGRAYRITGAAHEPPFPKPTIVVDLPNATSAQQGKVSVRLGEPSRAIGSGTLRIEFRASSGAVLDDEAVRFTRGTPRTAAFSITEGAQTPVSEFTFQTGTTAGTIVFTAEVGGWTSTATMEIAPQTVHIDRTRAIRNGSMLEVEITGYDNTRTLDAIAFTFYTARGDAIQPGAIRVSAAPDFRRHFEGSVAGGAFVMRAVFPVAGAVADIASAEVKVTNSAGTTESGKIQLQ